MAYRNWTILSKEQALNQITFKLTAQFEAAKQLENSPIFSFKKYQEFIFCSPTPATCRLVDSMLSFVYLQKQTTSLRKI